MVWAPGPPPDPPSEPILSIDDNIGIGAGKESGLKRRALVAAVALLAVALLVASGSLWRWVGRRSKLPAPSAQSPDRPADDAAITLLEGIPLYRPLLSAKALRSGRVDGDGILHVEVDLRAVVEPRLAALGFPGASELLPATARGTIARESVAGTTSTLGLRESWSFDGPAAGLDLLDRNPAGPAATLALDAIPGAPSAMVSVRLMPSRLADPSLGGAALASWIDRANFAEKLLGRPFRAQIAEDLAGPAVFALYEGSDDTQAEAIFAAELRRSDRLVGLLDMLFGLGALTERATVIRYRGVSTGSFVSTSGGPGLALAVDGTILFVATSRARLESAIDARRAISHPRGTLAASGAPDASWSAVSASAFVRHGWARLARSADEPRQGLIMATTASLRPEGASGWRLDGHGPAPAITADPILPFLRSVLERRQRGSD